jgi:hypothetical protein
MEIIDITGESIIPEADVLPKQELKISFQAKKTK